MEESKNKSRKPGLWPSQGLLTRGLFSLLLLCYQQTACCTTSGALEHSFKAAVGGGRGAQQPSVLRGHGKVKKVHFPPPKA